MTLTDLTNMANAYADESISTSMTVHFFNACVGDINATLKTLLPLIDATDNAFATTAYTALGTDATGDSWLIALFVPYIAEGIKKNDGSINEADRYSLQFSQALNRLKKVKKSVIPTEYQGEGFGGAYLITPFSRW